MRYFLGGSRSGFFLDIAPWIGVFLFCSTIGGANEVFGKPAPGCGGFGDLGERIAKAPIVVHAKAVDVVPINKTPGLAEGQFSLVHTWKGSISSTEFIVPVYSVISEGVVSVRAGKYYVMNLESDGTAGAGHYKRFGCKPMLEVGAPSPDNKKLKYINELISGKTKD